MAIQSNSAIRNRKTENIDLFQLETESVGVCGEGVNIDILGISELKWTGMGEFNSNDHYFWRPWFDSWVRKIPWRRDRLPTPVFLGFPCGSAGKEPACNMGDLGSIPGLGRSPGEGKGYLLQYSGLENSMDCV